MSTLPVDIRLCLHVRPPQADSPVETSARRHFRSTSGFAYMFVSRRLTHPLRFPYLVVSDTCSTTGRHFRSTSADIYNWSYGDGDLGLANVILADLNLNSTAVMTIRVTAKDRAATVADLRPWIELAAERPKGSPRNPGLEIGRPRWRLVVCFGPCWRIGCIAEGRRAAPYRSARCGAWRR